MVLFVGQYNEELAIESVEFATLGLLAGMMILVYLTQQSGIYDYIAVKAGQFSRGKPFRLVVMMVATVAEPPDGAPEVSGPIPWSDAAKAALDATGHLVLVEPRGERVGAELGRFSRKGR